MSDARHDFDDALYEIGRLTYVWTNTESLLLHLIAGLLEIDKERALILFLTLNTTRARVDLVERLAKHAAMPAPRLRRMLALMRQLSALSGERNLYSHAIYAFDPEQGEVSAIQMRIADRATDIRMGRRRRLDAQAVADLRGTVGRIAALNADLWRLIAAFGYPA